MANINNILDETYRKNFLKIADYKTLNEYLKNMEKLSKKKPQYLAMYNNDLEYLLNLNDKYFQDGGNLFGLITGQNDSSKKIMTEQPVCDTEGYIKKINNLAENSYCAMITQQTAKCDNRCTARFEEMQLIEQILIRESSCHKIGKDWETAIRKFIDIIVCCGDTFTKEDYDDFRKIYFKRLSKLITSNSKFVVEAYNYLNKILKNEKKKISEEFIRKYSDLRKRKLLGQFTQNEYNLKKDSLIKEYIESCSDGFSIVYTSKITEKIINVYKKLVLKNENF